MKKILVYICLFLVSVETQAQWQQITLETIDEYRVLSGEVEAVNKATVSSQTSGRVDAFYYDVDDFVSQGSIIAEFTNTEQKASLKQVRANADAAKIIYDQSIIDYNRTKEVYKKKLIAKSILDKALSDKNSSKAKSTAAIAAVINAEKQLEYTIIRAPYDGIVTKRFVEVGEVVNPGTAIMEGLSLDKLRVVTDIPEAILTKIKSHSQAKIRSGEQSFLSQKITIFPYANQASHTFKTRLEFDSMDTALYPGMTVKVAFKVGEYKTIMIPLSALMTKSELSLVYVKYQGEKLLRQVKLGRIENNKVEVLSGLSVNDTILTTP